MAMMKVIEKAFPLPRGPYEVNGKHASLRLQNPAHLISQLLACFSRQMMKHYGCEHHIELSVGKGQRLGERFFENDLDTGLYRFPPCPCNHLRRSVQPVDRACWPDLSFRSNGKSSRAAAHVQNRLARFKMRQAKHLLTKGTLSPERYHPDQ